LDAVLFFVTYYAYKQLLINTLKFSRFL